MQLWAVWLLRAICISNRYCAIGKKGDKLALRIIDEVGRILGTTIANIANIVDPEIIIIGGGVSNAGNILLETIQKHYEEAAFYACRDVKFALARLGNDAGIYGCAALCLELREL